MHKHIEKIKKYEQKPFVIKNFISLKEAKIFQNLYDNLPVEIDNKRQKIIKKKWSTKFYSDLQKIYIDKLNTNLRSYKMDNPLTKNGDKNKWQRYNQ